MREIRACLLVAVCALSGCASMNPYIQHGHGSEKSQVIACEYNGHSDKALKYACQMTARMEKARAQIVGTRSAITATLFPIAAIIGYNTARGINSATSAALAAGGLAGYSAATTLAQADRIRVYDEGLRSMSCAIGIYQRGKADAAPETANRLIARSRLITLHDQLSESRKHTEDGTSSAVQMDNLLSVADGLERWLNDSDPNRTIETQLVEFIRNIVAKVNSQLTLTVPDNVQLAGDAISTIQVAGSSQRNWETLPDGFLAPKARGVADMSTVNVLSVTSLLSLFKTLETDTPANTSKLNLDDCSYNDLTDIGVKDSISRFMLGPGDQYSGKTLSIIRGNAFDVTISGGVPPYHAAVSVLKGTDNVHADVSGANLKILVDDPGAGKPGVGEYQIVVNDSTNRFAKILTVTVPAVP